MKNKATDNISFHYQQAGFKFPNRNRLKAFLLSLFKKEQKELNTLTYIFCSDDYLLEINKSFLQHDYYTDIITFELAEKNQATEGEIYISIDRVKDNAQSEKTSFTKELHRVIFHGALHLCGYKDKTPQQEKQMRAKEDEWMERYFG